MISEKLILNVRVKHRVLNYKTSVIESQTLFPKFTYPQKEKFVYLPLKIDIIQHNRNIM